VKFYTGDFHENLSRNLAEIRQKYQALFTKTKICFIVIGNINMPYKHFSATLRIFILLTATFSLKIHTTHCCLPIATVVLQTCHNVVCTLSILSLVHHGKWHSKSGYNDLYISLIS